MWVVLKDEAAQGKHNGIVIGHIRYVWYSFTVYQLRLVHQGEISV